MFNDLYERSQVQVQPDGSTGAGMKYYLVRASAMQYVVSGARSALGVWHKS